MAIAIAVTTAVPLLAHGVTRYHGGRWYDGRGFRQATWYSVNGLLQSRWEGKVDAEVDLTGKFIIPPLADGHTHDFTTDRDLQRVIDRYIANGVFYARNMNGIIRLTSAVRPKMNLAESVDVSWATAGVTASGGHPVQIYQQVVKQIPGWTAADLEDNAYFIVDTVAEIETKWPVIAAAEPDFIKAYLETSEEYAKRKDDPAYFGKRGLSPAVLKALVARAHSAGLPVSVHVTTATDFRTAVDAGADEIAHLPLAIITEDDAAAAAKRNVTVVTTTLSHRPTGGIDADAVYAANLALLRKAGARISIGTDSGRSAVDELLNVARLLPSDSAFLLNAAVIDTPRAIFPERKIGRFQEGYEASFLALDADPLQDLANVRKISLRVKTGHVLAVKPARPEVGELLVPIIMKDGVDAALAHYQKARADSSFAYDDSEASFNKLGYVLLQHGQIDGAITIFQFNTKNYPGSSNVWDSLGEAWMKKGDRAKAMENYRKSLELNPHNENAREKLRELRAD